MNFCGNCGARVKGTAFCTNCGQPLAATAKERQPSGSATVSPAAGGREAQPAPPESEPDQAQARSIRTNPFAAIPVGDYVRDFLAVLFLLVPLGMAWDLEDNATGKVYVILVTLLSVVSLALPYLRASSVLPPTLAPAQIRLIRLGANAPYAVVVLITLILGFVGDGSVGGVDIGGGVGVAMAIGFVGAVLAAQARASEQEAGGDGGLWKLVMVGLAGLGVLLGLLSAIIFIIDVGDQLEWSLIVAFIVIIAFFVGLPAVAAAGAFRGDAAWRDAAIVIGGIGLMAAFWVLGAAETIGDAWSLRLDGPRFLLWPAIGAAAAAAGLATVRRPIEGARRWIGLSQRLLDCAVLVAGAAVLIYGFRLIEDEPARPALITVLVFSLVALAAAFVGRNALAGSAVEGRPVAMAVSAALVIVGIIQAAVLGSAESAIVDQFGATSISAFFVLSGTVMVALTVPPSVRRDLGQFTLGSAGAGAAGAAGTTTTAGPSEWKPAAGEPMETASDVTPPGRSEAEKKAAAEKAAAEKAAAEKAEADKKAAAEKAAAEKAEADKKAVAEKAEAEKAAAEKAAAEKDDSTRVIPVTEAAGSSAPSDDDSTQAFDAQDDSTQVIGAQPAAPAAPEPEAPNPSGYTAAIASDPGTPLQTLADIAAKEPSLRPNLALNPSTYPELLEWLGHLGDPAVDDALRRRGG